MAQIAVNEGMDIKDTDKVKGISAGDFANEENYKIVRNAILNKTSKHYDINNTKNIFKEWLVRGGSDQHAYGTSLRADKKTDKVDLGRRDSWGIYRSDMEVRGLANALQTYGKGREIPGWDNNKYIVKEPGKTFEYDGDEYSLQDIWDNNLGSGLDFLKTGGGGSKNAIELKAEDGKINTSELILNQPYLYNGNYYTWNGTKLIPV
jgi:hypothetical protein